MRQRLNIAGQRFGRVVALEWVGVDKRGHGTWRCLCDCGTAFVTLSDSLKQGRTNSCGCLKRESSLSRCFKNISLQQFGRLMPSFPLGRRGTQILWACLCDCGNTTAVACGDLRSEHTTSCGCFAAEMSAATFNRLHRLPNFKPAATHGLSASLTYSSWMNMKNRCTNPKSNRWLHYGGANSPVQVCERWLHSFEAFLEDLGERPLGTSLGRFADSGDYEPGNCSWQTKQEQGLERRMHHQFQFVAVAA